jgi:hypothetical protein
MRIALDPSDQQRLLRFVAKAQLQPEYKGN